MSVEASSAVWNYSLSKGTERLVLLAIANEANNEGECSAYRRTQAWLAKRVNVTSIETVRRAVRALEELGELQVMFTGTGKSPSNYWVTLPGLRPPPTRGGTVEEAPTHQRGEPPPTGGVGPHPPEGAEAPVSVLKPVLTHSLPLETAARAPLDGPQGVDDLCRLLADRVAAHRSTGARPVMTQKWGTDMRLLLERGPLHVEAPAPLEPQRVARAIDVVFTELAEHGRDGFCWADQIRSPYSLRDHWVQLAEAARRAHATRVSRGAAVLDRRDTREGRDGGGPPAERATSVLAGTSLDPTRAIDVQPKGEADG